MEWSVTESNNMAWKQKKLSETFLTAAAKAVSKISEKQTAIRHLNELIGRGAKTPKKVLLTILFDPNLKLNLTKEAARELIHHPNLLPDEMLRWPDYPDIRENIVNSFPDPEVEHFVDEELENVGFHFE